jgi:hypothetical protein
MMDSIDLNLASRPLRNNTLLWVGHSVLTVGLLGATAWNVTSYATSRGALSDLTAQRDSFQSRMNDLSRREVAANRGIAAFDVKELQVRASKAADVIERKALSWTRLFNRMEEVFPYEVRMVSVRPVFNAHRTSAADPELIPEGAIPVSVEGIARNLDAFLELERALIFDPHFDGVEPHRYDRTESGEVRFDLRFLYYPDPPQEEVAPPEDAQAAAPGEAPPDAPPAEVGDPWEGSTEEAPGGSAGEGTGAVEEAQSS